MGPRAGAKTGPVRPASTAQSRFAAGLGPPQNRRGSPGISARQAHKRRGSPIAKQEAARGAQRATHQKTMDEATPARFDAEAAAPARRGDEQILLAAAARPAAYAFLLEAPSS